MFFFSFFSFVVQVFFGDAAIDVPGAEDSSPCGHHDSGRLAHFARHVAAMDLRLALHRRQSLSATR